MKPVDVWTRTPGPSTSLVECCRADFNAREVDDGIPRSLEGHAEVAGSVHGNWIYTDSAMSLAFAASCGPVSIDGQIAQATSGIVDFNTVYRHLPLIDAPKVAGHRAPHVRDWASHPTRDAYWNDISFENDHDKVTVPMLTIAGWYDIFLRGAINDDIAVRAKAKEEEARAGKRLMIGPWIHGGGRRNNVAPGAAADPNATDFGPLAEVDLQKIYLRWFDYWLKGIQNGVRDEPPIKIFVMGENVWRYESEWPLARAQATKYYIASGGRGTRCTAMACAHRRCRRAARPRPTPTHTICEPGTVVGRELHVAPR